MRSRDKVSSILHAQRHIHLGSTDLEGLGADLIPRLVLSHVGEEADDLVSLFCMVC